MKSIWFVMVAGALVVPSLAGAEPAANGAAPVDATTVATSKEGGAAAPAPAGARPDLGARSRVALLLGLFTPTGEAGIEYTQNVASFLEVGLGAGRGFSGIQGAVMPRLRAGSGALGVTLGAGLSGGHYREPQFFCWGEGPCMDTETTALWVNVEAGVQVTSRTGFTMSLYGGVGSIAISSGCSGPDCDELEGNALPYGGIAIGHTL